MAVLVTAVRSSDFGRIGVHLGHLLIVDARASSRASTPFFSSLQDVDARVSAFRRPGQDDPGRTPSSNPLLGAPEDLNRTAVAAGPVMTIEEEASPICDSNIAYSCHRRHCERPSGSSTRGEAIYDKQWRMAAGDCRVALSRSSQ
jgi:hypothetical protein